MIVKVARTDRSVSSYLQRVAGKSNNHVYVIGDPMFPNAYSPNEMALYRLAAHGTVTIRFFPEDVTIDGRPGTLEMSANCSGNQAVVVDDAKDLEVSCVLENFRTIFSNGIVKSPKDLLGAKIEVDIVGGPLPPLTPSDESLYGPKYLLGWKWQGRGARNFLFA